MYFCIKYHKEKESTYLYFIEKTDKYILYNWNKKDTIFLKTCLNFFEELGDKP